MKILVLCAHPDDEILGMGGTLRKYVQKKAKIKIIFFATGIHSRRSTDYQNKPVYDTDKKTQNKMNKQVKKLRTEALAAAKIIGIKNIEFVDFPDNEMDTVSNLQITKKIEKTILDFNPDEVFTHSPNDLNIDHRMIYYSTLTATRPTINCNIQRVFSFEVPSSTEWNFSSSFSPNVFVDISNELNVKLNAMKAYKHEIQKFPHPRSVEALNAIAKRWGSVSGFKAAEAFHLVRELKK